MTQLAQGTSLRMRLFCVVGCVRSKVFFDGRKTRCRFRLQREKEKEKEKADLRVRSLEPDEMYRVHCPP